MKVSNYNLWCGAHRTARWFPIHSTLLRKFNYQALFLLFLALTTTLSLGVNYAWGSQGSPGSCQLAFVAPVVSEGMESLPPPTTEAHRGGDDGVHSELLSPPSSNPKFYEPEEAMTKMKRLLGEHHQRAGVEDGFATAVADRMVTLALAAVSDAISKASNNFASAYQQQVKMIIAALKKMAKHPSYANVLYMETREAQVFSGGGNDKRAVQYILPRVNVVLLQETWENPKTRPFLKAKMRTSCRVWTHLASRKQSS